jgi:exosome complex component RRP40
LHPPIIDPLQVCCLDAEFKARGMGLIPAPGLVILVSLNYARRLLSPDDEFLTELGREIKFETTIGMNGRIW